MRVFVYFGLYFVPDENYFINPSLQVGSGTSEKITKYGSGGQKINEFYRIRILIPAHNTTASGVDNLICLCPSEPYFCCI